MTKISGLPQDNSPSINSVTVEVDANSGQDKKVPFSAMVALFAKKRTTSITSSATPTPNVDTTDVLTITALATGMTLQNPTGSPVNGQSLIVRIKDNGTSQTIAYGTSYRAIGVTLPTTTTASKTTYLGMVYNADDVCYDILSVGRQ